ncbi:protein of unknown function [Nitrospira japonica]|uniref:Uncharacterized protein n=1 Tax=Nitrospira japonica TaxID=1325564 RepID=A0A1W1I1W9_9BACT|nr:protein of unknown function [Nitrospira japonica]
MEGETVVSGRIAIEELIRDI